MTEPEVRVLLTELADSVDPPDLATAAWDRSVHRRRVRTMIAAGAVAAAVAIAVSTTYLRADNVAVTPTHPPPTTSDVSRSVGEIKGFSVAVAPALSREPSLSAVESPLPPTIDLAAPNPSVLDEPLPTAVAAYGITKVGQATARFDGVMLIGPNGELRHLDATRLQPMDSRSDDGFLPFTAGSLSADGTRLAFAQPHGVAVFDIPTGDWTDYSLPLTDTEALDLHWAGDQSIRLGATLLNTMTGATSRVAEDSPLDHTGLNVEYWWGPESTFGDLHARGAAYLDEKAPPNVDRSPPAVVVAGDGTAALLLIPDQGGRWKNCCAVAGWLDEKTLAYESTSSPDAPDLVSSQVTRVLAWDTATDNVGLVTTVTGSADMLFRGSYRDLER